MVRTPQDQGDQGHLPPRPTRLAQGDHHERQDDQLLDDPSIERVGSREDQLRRVRLGSRQVAGLQQCVDEAAEYQGEHAPGDDPEGLGRSQPAVGLAGQGEPQRLS